MIFALVIAAFLLIAAFVGFALAVAAAWEDYDR